MREDWAERRQRGRRFFGIFIAGFAVYIMLKMFGVLPPIFYSIHFGWSLILVVIGLFIGVKSGFRNNAWWILMLIGGIFAFPPFDVYGVSSQMLLWPALLLFAGLMMTFSKKKTCDYKDPSMRFMRHQEHRQQMQEQQLVMSDSDSVNMNISFGGRKEIVTSKSFKGGLIRASFAGVELNLTSAEPGVQPMVLEIHASFAGIELIVPSQWEVYNEIDPMMGNVEDQRRIRTYDNPTAQQTLILRGSCTCGSIAIKSF